MGEHGIEKGMEHYHRISDNHRISDTILVKALFLLLSFFGGIILTGAVAWGTYVREAVTISAVNEQIDIKDKNIQTEIDNLIKIEQQNIQMSQWVMEHWPSRDTKPQQ